jgi:tellurite resistance protein TerC
MIESIAQSPHWVLYLVFGGIIFLFLVVDLGLLNRAAKKLSSKAALFQSAFWIAISFLFCVFIYYYYLDLYKSLAFFSAYATEKALSFDNMFVMLLILNYFKIESKYHHRILTWGILGALVFRGIFIFVGLYLIDVFRGILYLFSIFLIYSGIKLFLDKEEDHVEPEKNLAYRLIMKILPMKSGDHQGKFIVKENGKLLFTTLFLVLILIESTDIFFAADSIPAAFAISDDRFIIYTSNIFAVLGLRALFFLLSSILDRFYLLQKGVSLILIFIGVKLGLDMFGYELPAYISFSIIILFLSSSILASMLIPQPGKEAANSPTQ